MLRPLELALVANELNDKLTGAFLQKAWAPLRRVLFIELRVPGRSTTLVLNAEPEVGRIAVTAGRMTAEKPAGLQQWVRQELIGGQLTAVRCADRVVELAFLTREGPRSLVLDLNRNLLMVVRNAKVLAVSTEEQPPPVMPGAVFELPEPTADQSDSRLQPNATDAFPFAQSADALLGTRDDARRLVEARRRVLTPLKSKRARALRTLAKVEEEANREALAQAHKRYGELLAQNLHALAKGAKSVRLNEYTADGVTEVDVPLDEKLPPRDQPEAHFKKYRRYSRGAEHAKGRLLVLREALRVIDEELAALMALTDEALLTAPMPSAPVKRAAARHEPFRTYKSKSGARIFVGKNSQDNDVLTFKVARPFDLWLHARGVPGSHVVIPLTRGAEVSQDLLIDAAHLALHHSPRKGERMAEVASTYAKFVRKVKDGAPGQVVYTREKVINVRVEPDRLERLLKTAEP